MVRRPDDRLQSAGGVTVEDDDAVPVLGADDPQGFADLLVVDAQVAHVVRGGVADARPPAGPQVQGVELVAGLQEGVGQVGLEEVVVAAVKVEDGPFMAGGSLGAGCRGGPALVDQDGVVRVGGRSFIEGDIDATGHPRLPQDVRGHLGRGRRGGCCSRGGRCSGAGGLGVRGMCGGPSRPGGLGGGGLGHVEHPGTV